VQKRLTVARIADLKAPKKGQLFLWDREVPGLAVRLTPKGAKSYIFQKSHGGRSLRMTIGATSAWKLPEAREEARRLHRLIDKGIDPRLEKADQKRLGALEGMQVEDMWTEYLEAHQDRWSDRHMADNEYMSREDDGEKAAGILRPLLEMGVGEIDAPTLIKWAKKALSAKSKHAINQGKHSALRKGYIRFKAFWRWAYQREEYKNGMADPSIFSNPDLKALIPKIKPKRDVLEKGQLEAWFDAVSKISTKVISAYLQILLLTGTRRRELSSLEWKHVDDRWKKIHLKDKVEEEGRDIPLTPYVEFLISSLSRTKGYVKNEYVFSSKTSKSGKLEEPRIAHKNALRIAGLPEDLSLHGLRRSFSTLSEWIEMPSGITAQIMGHKPSAIQEKHYKSRPLDLLAMWHCKLEKWILDQAGIKFDPEKAKGGLQVIK